MNDMARARALHICLFDACHKNINWIALLHRHVVARTLNMCTHILALIRSYFIRWTAWSGQICAFHAYHLFYVTMFVIYQGAQPNGSHLFGLALEIRLQSNNFTCPLFTSFSKEPNIVFITSIKFHAFRIVLYCFVFVFVIAHVAHSIIFPSLSFWCYFDKWMRAFI